MFAVNYRELSQMYRTLGPNRTCRQINEWLEAGRRGETGGMKPEEFSIRDMAEALVENGPAWVRSLDPRRDTAVMEAGEGIDTTAFSNITGQLLISKILDGYQNEAFSVSQMFETIPTRLDGEKIPGITMLGDKAEIVQPGMPYPNVGVGEDYTETPSTTKRGFIVPVTKEAIFFDRTGLLLRNAGQVGESLGLNKEKRCNDLLIGADNNYKWKGTSYNTYQTATPWINTLSGAAYDLADWTDVDAAEQLFADMLDPNTGEPILISGMGIIATPARQHALNRIITATEIRYTVSSAETQTLAANPLANYQRTISRFLYQRLQNSSLGKTAAQAAATWFIGDFRKAFAYMENWPITVVQAPVNSEAEFTQDIVMRFKASERGVPAVMDPRFVVKVNGHA